MKTAIEELSDMASVSGSLAIIKHKLSTNVPVYGGNKQVELKYVTPDGHVIVKNPFNKYRDIKVPLTETIAGMVLDAVKRSTAIAG